LKCINDKPGHATKNRGQGVDHEGVTPEGPSVGKKGYKVVAHQNGVGKDSG